MNVKQTPATDM